MDYHEALARIRQHVQWADGAKVAGQGCPELRGALVAIEDHDGCPDGFKHLRDPLPDIDLADANFNVHLALVVAGR